MLLKEFENLEEFKKAVVSGKRPKLEAADLPESLRAIVEQSHEGDAKKRRSLAELIKVLEVSILEYAVPDEEAREYWSLCNKGHTLIKYKQLESDLMDFLDVHHLEIPELGKFLKLLLSFSFLFLIWICAHSKRFQKKKVDNRDAQELVGLEYFGKIWTW